MSIETFVQNSMGGLPEFEEYDVRWGAASRLSADTVKRVAEE
jgi:hypothetical protein